jgi:hypothetical protein
VYGGFPDSVEEAPKSPDGDRGADAGMEKVGVAS